MLDPFYNGVLGVILLLWLISFRLKRTLGFVAWLKKHRIVIVGLLWVIFIAFSVAYVARFDYMSDIHDIDDAVEAGVAGVETGINPYEQDIVPRFTTGYSEPIQWSYGHYNYMPFDLLFYTFFEKVLGFLGTPLWFVVTNLVVSGIAFFLLRRLIPIKPLSYVPLTGIVMLFYSFDNGSLTLFLIIASVYALKKSKTHPEVIALVLMGLATLTKIYAALPLAALFLFLVQKYAKSRDWRMLSETTTAAVGAGVMAVAFIVPFGIMNVLQSAVLFNADPVARAGTSMGGTVLSELILGGGLFSVISIAFMALALALGMFLKDLNDRVILATSVFLVVAVQSSLSPLAVAGVFLCLKLRDRVLRIKSEQAATELRERDARQAMTSAAGP